MNQTETTQNSDAVALAANSSSSAEKETLIERLLDAAELDFRCCGQANCNAV